MKQEEVSMVDEILSTPEGRAAMRMAEENAKLRKLLAQASILIIDASCLYRPNSDEGWRKDYVAFRRAYVALREQ